MNDSYSHKDIYENGIKINTKNDNNKNKKKIILYSKNEDIKTLNIKTKRKNSKNDLNNLIESNEKFLMDPYKNIKENKINIKIHSDPKDIQFLKDIIEDSFDNFGLDNIFCVFKSVNNILYLIYSSLKSIICYNIIDNKKINEIKNAHNKDITNFRHCLDKINHRDLVISISCDDNNIKLWNMNNLKCLLSIKNINKRGDLYSACFLNDNNQIFIITSNKCYGDTDPIKVYDLNGNKIKEIKNSNYKTFSLETYYDNKTNKNFIIAGNVGSIISYDYNLNKIYRKYGSNNRRPYASLIINIFNFEKRIPEIRNTSNISKEILKLIGSSYDGIIRIWNFHSGELLRRITSSNNKIYGMCLWDNLYLFVGCYDKTIKLIDLKNGKVVKNLEGHNKDVLTIKKIIHPEYGECLISQSLSKDQLKKWINKI